MDVSGNQATVVHDSRPRQGVAAPASRTGEESLRSLYYCLVHIDEHYDRLPAAERLVGECLAAAAQTDLPTALQLPETAPATLGPWVDAARCWRAGIGDRIVRRLGRLSLEDAGRLLMQCGPAALVEGGALQYVSGALTSHLDTVALLLRSYIRSCGDGDPVRHRGNAYLDLCRAMAVPLPEAGSWALARHPDIIDAMFVAPAFQLAIAQFPVRLLPELLGVNLFNAISLQHPVIEGIAPQIRQALGAPRYLALTGDSVLAAQAIADAVAAIEAQLRASATLADGAAAADWLRLRRGFAAGFALQQAALDAILALVDGPAFGAEARMVELVRRKAPFAFGYHQQRRLGDRSIDAWFDPTTFDAARFVAQLARSPYVRPGEPRRSALTTTSVAARGSMAGIFTKDELATMAQWIEALPGRGEPAGAEPGAGTQAAPAPVPAAPPRRAAAGQADKTYAKLSTRELYHHLLHVERYPDLLGYARSYATLWLSRAGVALEKGQRPIPFLRYDHDALDAWLVAQHATQVKSYVGGDDTPVPPREQVIASSVQLCPMVLIDGAWLQRMCGVAYSGTAIGSQLFRIYLDEVGNGDATENHPNVYRELMAEMGVELPPFGSLAFALWSGFEDAAFLVPTFWLCIAQFPRHFLSEILGLNLAMELSGVGGSYRSGSDMLRHYGFTPTFVDLHNTVDNAATGHSAMALNAIKTHLDEMLACGGAEEVQRRWKRVWTGYRALTPPAGFA